MLTQEGQKEAIIANIWYGVQQVTNAPRIKEIVFNAFRALFSVLSFSFFFFLKRIRFPILLIKSWRSAGLVAESWTKDKERRFRERYGKKGWLEIPLGQEPLAIKH